MTTDLLDFQFNTMVAALIECSNALAEMKTPELMATAEWREAIRTMVLLMAPSTPYVAEELWERLGGDYSVHTQNWPSYDETLAKDDFVELVIQINGKVRDRVTLPVGCFRGSRPNRRCAPARRSSAALNGVQIVREIYVPGRLMNYRRQAKLGRSIRKPAQAFPAPAFACLEIGTQVSRRRLPAVPLP